MILIKQYKKIFSLFLIFLFLIFVSFFLIFNSPGSKGSILDEFLVLLDKKSFSHQFRGEKTTFKKIYKDLTNYNNFNFLRADLDKLIIDVNFKDYNLIKLDRKKNLSLYKDEQYLIYRSDVNAKINFKDKTYFANIRLKGDRADHWKNNKRLSLMMNLKKGQSINGNQKFSITGHARRAFPQNEAISKFLSKTDVIVPTFHTYRVNFNGQNWGQMYGEESFSASFYEKRKLKESPIVKFTNSADGRIPAMLATDNHKRDFLQDLFDLQGIYEINVYKEKKFSKNKTNLERIFFLQHFNYFLNKKNLSKTQQKKLINYLDVKKFASVFAINSLFYDWHSIGKENIRYYLNPFNLKIEPIPTDMLGQSHLNNFGKILNFNEFKSYIHKAPLIYSVLFIDENFRAYYFDFLNFYYTNLSSLKKDITDLCKYESRSCKNSINFNTIKKNYDLIIKNKSKLFDKDTNIEKANYNNIEKKISKINEYGSEKIIKNLDNFIYSRFYDDGEIYIDNLFYFPIKLTSIKINKSINNRICDVKKSINRNLLPTKSIKFKIIDNKILECLKNGGEYQIQFHINGSKKTQNFYIYPEKFKNKFFETQTESNLKSNDIDYLLFKRDIIINKGNYNIKKPLIILNKNLIIEAGTKLNFDEKTFIKIINGNIIIKGKKNDPVHLFSSGNKWRGIYVNNSNASKLNNVMVENLDFFKDNLFTNLTGGINFHNSVVTVDNLKISNIFAEDAINFTHSQVNLDNLQIQNANSDGADLDFCTGKINNFNSNNIVGDGLDFSGSKIKITSGSIKNTGDKAISIGEKSDILIKGTYIENADMGIAVKDNSIAYVENNNYVNNNIDINMYMKKSYYNVGGTLFIDKRKKNRINIKKDNLSIINTIN